ncbi:MAG: hypothetical protein ABJ311_13140 [Erythrobacter sp.]
MTALGIGVGALALAPLDAGLTAGAVIGGAGLFARIKENASKAGLDDDKLIGRVQTRLLKQLDHWDQHAEREAAERADEAMTRLLPQVMLSREELASLVMETSDRKERYPILAARKIVDQLALHDTIFAQAPAGSAQNYEREFALEAVESGLRAGMEDPDYATLLTLNITIELGAAIAETNAMLAQIKMKQEQDSASIAYLVQREKEREAAEGRDPVPDDRIIALARKIVEKVEDPAQAAQILEDNIDIYLDMLVDRERGSNLGDAADAAFERVLTLIDAQDYAGAVSQAEREYRRLHEEEREQAEQMAARKIRMAKTGLRAARLDVDAQRAAFWEAESVRLDEGKSALSVNDLRRIQDVWYERSLKGGNALEMSVAIELARLSIAESNGPQERAMCQNDLAIALKVQGERLAGQAGVALLSEAVTAYRAALEVHTSDHMPVQWAITQNNLGTALKTQGERLSGKTGAGLLGEAVTAYRAALEVHTRDQMPVDWAMTQNNLGNALRTQGERLSGEAGAGLLGEAVTAYRAALEVHTRDQMPVQWATTQNNLGNALKAQGEWLGGEAGTQLLGEAVTAYRAALEVFTRDQMPAQWATTQNNLAGALVRQGERLSGEAGAALLGEAVNAYRAALEVYTRDQMPADWAMTQENMAIGFLSLAAANAPRRCDHLRAARAAVQAALTVYTPDSMPYYYGQATRLLTVIEAQIAEHGCDGCAAAPQS